MKLVTFCIPTRGRPRGLRETIDSILETTSEDCFDVIAGVDEDDETTINAIPTFRKYGNVSFGIAPRGPKGYGSLGDVVTRIANMATTPWVAFIDDDMLLLGKGWVQQLEKLPLEGHIAHPEFYWLSSSRYPSGSCGPVGPFVPNRCWEKFGHNRICHPHDDFLHQMTIRGGWKYCLLKDITLKHEWRKTDEDQRPIH